VLDIKFTSILYNDILCFLKLS